MKTRKAFYCHSCESEYTVVFDKEKTYLPEPEVCPFCSELIELDEDREETEDDEGEDV